MISARIKELEALPANMRFQATRPSMRRGRNREKEKKEGERGKIYVHKPKKFRDLHGGGQITLYEEPFIKNQ